MRRFRATRCYIHHDEQVDASVSAPSIAPRIDVTEYIFSLEATEQRSNRQPETSALSCKHNKSRRIE